MGNTSISLTKATGGDARVLRFPERTGTGDPGVATLVLFDEHGRRIIDLPAEGEIRVEPTDGLGLTFDKHRPGEVTRFLESEEQGTYSWVSVESGELDDRDMSAIGRHDVRSLTLGWSGHDRYGRRHAKPIRYPTEPDRFALLGSLAGLGVHSDSFGDEHLLSLSSRSGLRGLVLSGTAVTSTGLAHSGLHRLEDLWLSDGESFVDDLSFVRRLPTLESLTLRDPEMSDRHLRDLTVLPLLAELDVRYTRVGRFSLDVLSSLPRLHTLDLTGTRVGDDTVGTLEPIPGLRKLKLGDTMLTDAAVPLLGRLAHVDRLWLTRTAITDDGLAELVRAKPALHTLDISQTRITVDGLRHLQHLPKLWRLEIAPSQLTEEAVEMLADTTTIDEIGLRGKLASLDLFGMIADYIGAAQTLPDV